MYSYIYYDDTGKILYKTRRTDAISVTGNILKLEGDVDVVNKKIVNGKLISLTSQEIADKEAQKIIDKNASILSGLNEIKAEVLAVKVNQPETYELLKVLGILHPKVDQL